MSLRRLQDRYKRHVKSECGFGKNLVNPSRCPAGPKYYNKLNDFIEASYKSSVNDTKNNQEKLLQDRLKGKKYKEIYPIVNHDFDYKTAYKKKFNPYELGITNEPTIDNLWQSPNKFMKFYEGLVRDQYPNQSTRAGYDDVILEDTRRVQIKNKYKYLDEQLPYPTFRKDYPECLYPTTGKNSSSYFIKVGKCKSTVNNEKDCVAKQFQWVPNSNKFPKIAVSLAAKKKAKKGVQNISKGTCYKPQFAYIDNTSKGFYGQNGIAPSMINDIMNVSPEKLSEILAGNSIEGSGIVPCVEDFSNMGMQKYQIIMVILMILILGAVYMKSRL